MDHVHALLTIDVDGIPCTLLRPNAASIQAAPYDSEPKLGHYHWPRCLRLQSALRWWSLEYQGRKMEFPSCLIRFTDLMAAFIIGFRLIDLFLIHGRTPSEPKRGHYHRPSCLRQQGALCWWSLEYQGREMEFPSSLVRFTELIAAFIIGFRLIDLFLNHGRTPRAQSRQAMVLTNTTAGKQWY